MPYFESPALYIDMANLPAPSVIETIAYEDLLAAYKARVLAMNGSLAAALALEQSPLNIILETEAYGESIVRERINMAARAVMLPFAVGSDLDVLGALYNVARLPLVSNPRNFLLYPEDWQSDVAFRAQIQLSPEAFTTAGSAGAYIFHAKDSDPTIHDVSAIRSNDKGGVRVTVMSEGDDPIPTSTQLSNVINRLRKTNIKPLTDVLTVAAVSVVYIDVIATITLYPGPDSSAVLATIKSKLDSLKSDIHRIGRDLNISALYAAMNQPGIQNVKISSPASDTVVDETACVIIKSISITAEPLRRE